MITDGRAEDDLRDTHARRGEGILGYPRAEFILEDIALFSAVRLNDHFREGGIRQQRIERQIEPRLALADVTRDDPSFRLLSNHGFDLLDLVFGRLNGAASACSLRS